MRRNDGAARQLPVTAECDFEIDGLDAMLALPLRTVPEAAWRYSGRGSAGANFWLLDSEERVVLAFPAWGPACVA